MRKIFIASVLLLLSLALFAQVGQRRVKSKGNEGLTIEPPVPKYVMDITAIYTKW